MLESQLILCPIDFSEFSARAYHYALSLAEHYRAKLVAQHIVELWRYPSLGLGLAPHDCTGPSDSELAAKKEWSGMLKSRRLEAARCMNVWFEICVNCRVADFFGSPNNFRKPPDS